MLNGAASGTTGGAAAHYEPWHLAVVMPAFNEEGLPEFLVEIEAHLRPVVSHLSFVVVDDSSATPVSELLRATESAMRSRVTVIRNEENLGHGPSALRAYHGGLATNADLVLHVDGDGQFSGADVAALVADLSSNPGASAAVGVRTGRVDPWFRKILTRLARLLIASGSAAARDANTPLRVYRQSAIGELLGHVSAEATVPHLQFTIIERRLGVVVREMDVAHRVRRGESELGTTWQGARSLVRWPSRRLLRFSARAAREVLQCMARSYRRAESQPPLSVSREAAA